MVVKKYTYVCTITRSVGVRVGNRISNKKKVRIRLGKKLFDNFIEYLGPKLIKNQF